MVLCSYGAASGAMINNDANCQCRWKG